MANKRHKRKRLRYDRLAIYLAVLSALFFLLTKACAPSSDSKKDQETSAAATTTASESTTMDPAALGDDYDDDTAESYEETEAPAITDAAGRTQVYNGSGKVFAWVTAPDAFSADSDYTNKSCAAFLSDDTDSLNAAVSYYVYDAAEGYTDDNMDDPLQDEAAALSNQEGYSVDGPGNIEDFTVGGKAVKGVSLYLSHTGDDVAASYTSEYIYWVHLNDSTIVTCEVTVSSANDSTILSFDEAAERFMNNISEN